MTKRVIKGQCGGLRVEGVVGGAIRLMKQERELDKIDAAKAA